jgi:hypothetical protein
MNFDGAGAILALSDAAAFAANTLDFGSSDIIDLLKTTATSATWANNELTIKNGAQVIATLELTGNYTGDTFSVGSDGHGGTDITTNAPEQFDFTQSGQAFTSTGVAADISILAGTAHDTFTFDGNFGAITINGYLPGENVLNFDDSDFANIAAVEAHAAQDAHGDTIITLSAHDTITLTGVTLSQFEAHTSDWHFI